jgi:hypothetical protein
VLSDSGFPVTGDQRYLARLNFGDAPTNLRNVSTLCFRWNIPDEALDEPICQLLALGHGKLFSLPSDFGVRLSDLTRACAGRP